MRKEFPFTKFVRENVFLAAPRHITNTSGKNIDITSRNIGTVFKGRHLKFYNVSTRTQNRKYIVCQKRKKENEHLHFFLQDHLVNKNMCNTKLDPNFNLFSNVRRFRSQTVHHIHV